MATAGGIHVLGTAEELPEALLGGARARPEQTRHRLLDLERDPRFPVSYVALAEVGRLVAAVPVYEVRVDSWPAGPYDVGTILGTDAPASAWALLGGRADLSSGVLMAAASDGDLEARALGVAADVARERGRRPALLYADERLRTAAAAAGVVRSVEIGSRAVIEDVGSDLDAYLALLPARLRRRLVRPDLKEIERLGLRATVVRWEDVIDSVAPLVVEVARRHGAVDHRRLVQHRLRGWAANPDVEPVAFVVSHDGGLLGASLAWGYRNTLYVYELGLAPAAGRLRRTAYLELVFYAPLRYAWASGLRRIDLGLEGEEAKSRRGATLYPVYGIELAS